MAKAYTRPISLSYFRGSRSMVNIYEVSDCGEIIAIVKRHEAWPPKMIGALVQEVVIGKGCADLAMGLITKVLADGQERCITASFSTPRGVLYRRMAIHRHTKTSVLFIPFKVKVPKFKHRRL